MPPVEAERQELSFVFPDQPGDGWRPLQRANQEGRTPEEESLRPKPKALGLSPPPLLLEAFSLPLAPSMASKPVSALDLSRSLLPEKWSRKSRLYRALPTPRRRMGISRCRFKQKAMQANVLF